MRILLAHNQYQQSGGEDGVVRAEKALLEAHDNQISVFLINNDDVTDLTVKLKTALRVVYSETSKKKVKDKIREYQPDIVHVHNFFPLLTPSIYDACQEAGVPVVQTLHNYRTICPGALLMRNGKICEDCVIGSPYKAIMHCCYRDSLFGSLAVARMVAYHRKQHTWQNKVGRFIALTEFAKKKFVQAGFPEEKIVVKPNFYSGETGKVKGGGDARHGALFVGRLSQEKGVATLLRAWKALNIPLRIAGNGPLLNDITASGIDCMTALGRLPLEQVPEEMARAAFLVMPSEWYEGFPMVLVESFAHSLPVVASKLGAMAEIVENGVTGLHFEPGNAVDLAEKVQWMHDHPEDCRRMGENARRVYEEKYTPEKNYRMLMDVYRQAIEDGGRRTDDGGQRTEDRGRRTEGG